MKTHFTEKNLEAFIQMTRIYNSERELKRIPLDAEAHLLDLIRTGKYKEIKCPSYTKLSENISPMAGDDLTSYRYLVIAAITLSVVLLWKVAWNRIWYLIPLILCLISYLRQKQWKISTKFIRWPAPTMPDRYIC